MNWSLYVFPYIAPGVLVALLGFIIVRGDKMGDLRETMGFIKGTVLGIQEDVSEIKKDRLTKDDLLTLENRLKDYMKQEFAPISPHPETKDKA